jgi:hypothetical protein
MEHYRVQSKRVDQGKAGKKWYRVILIGYKLELVGVYYASCDLSGGLSSLRPYLILLDWKAMSE